jgi:hypothetical protein
VTSCGRENGWGCLPTPSCPCDPWIPLISLALGPRPGRVTHCRFEHAGQTFGSLTEAPRHPVRLLRTRMESSVVMNKPAEILDEDHELVIERVCAIDVAKASGMVCTRLPQGAAAGRRVSRVWEVAATTRAITELADHLVAVGIEQVTVESTSDYWRIWFYLLEEDVPRLVELC